LIVAIHKTDLKLKKATPSNDIDEL